MLRPDRAAGCSGGRRSARKCRSGRTDRGFPPRGDWARCHRRDRPRAGGGWDLGVSAPADPGLARGLVPLGDQPVGRPRMATTSNLGAPAPGPAPTPVRAEARSDHRGSMIPTWGMVTTRLMELRKRRGLMVALIAVNIGAPGRRPRRAAHRTRRRPQVLRTSRWLQHLHNSGAGHHVRFGFIVAAVVGCTAGRTTSATACSATS